MPSKSGKIYNMEVLSKKKLLDREEAAFYLGEISLMTLDLIAKKPKFNALIRIGGSQRGRVFYNRERLDEWISNNSGSF